MESLLLPNLKDKLRVGDHQHAFNANHSTTKALCGIASKIVDGLNIKRSHN